MNHYDIVAKYYDRLFESLNRVLKDIGASMCPPQPGLAVLDVGCGTGAMLERYARGGSRVAGLDASPGMLAVARQRLGASAQLTLGDATRMPYEDDAFDLVIATMFLHELDPATRKAVVEESRRVLQPDGRLLLIDFHDSPARTPKGWLYRGFNTLVERLGGRDHFRGYRHFVTHGAIPGLAEAHDLVVVDRKIVAGGNLAVFALRHGSAS